MEISKLACPNCGSENTVSVPLMYKRGHATGTATHKEIVGYDVETTTTTYSDGSKKTEETGRHAVYGDVTRPTYTVTDLAREIAPPPEPKIKQLEHDTMTVGCVSFGCLLPILSLVISLVAYKFSKLSGLENALTYIAAALVIWKLWNDRRTTNKKNRTQKEEYDQAMEEYTRSSSACAVVISLSHSLLPKKTSDCMRHLPVSYSRSFSSLQIPYISQIPILRR